MHTYALQNKRFLGHDPAIPSTRLHDDAALLLMLMELLKLISCDNNKVADISILT
jgi:hypothetical protein